MNSAATDTLFRVVWFITDLSGGHIPRMKLLSLKVGIRVRLRQYSQVIALPVHFHRSECEQLVL